MINVTGAVYLPATSDLPLFTKVCHEVDITLLLWCARCRRHQHTFATANSRPRISAQFKTSTAIPAAPRRPLAALDTEDCDACLRCWSPTACAIAWSHYRAPTGWIRHSQSYYCACRRLRRHDCSRCRRQLGRAACETS
jgi:hypothetical protein